MCQDTNSACASGSLGFTGVRVPTGEWTRPFPGLRPSNPLTRRFRPGFSADILPISPAFGGARLARTRSRSRKLSRPGRGLADARQ
jgi:hypothetical protein